MEPKNSHAKIQQIVDNYENEQIVLMGGLRFHMGTVLRKIEHYYYGKFLMGDVDTEGFKKFFWNLSHPRCSTASKAIDVDTKDIILRSPNPLKAWLKQMELRLWIKKNGFADMMNEIGDLGPQYGSVVLKTVKGKPFIVDLKNLSFDTSVKRLEETDIVEIHTYTPDEFAKTPWDGDKKKELIALYASQKKNQIKVFEAYLWEDGVRNLYIVGAVEDKSSKKRSTLPIGLYSQTDVKLPYREFHFGERITGRWLALGFVERLFDSQERVNELVNKQARAFHWTSKQLFQTRDQLLQKNLLTDSLDGDIVNVTSEITKVGVEDRNLAAFREEMRNWEALADKLCFTFESATGESFAAGTPFKLGFLSQQTVATYFGKKKENFGIFLKRVIEELVIPEFDKNSKEEHDLILHSGGEEMELFRDAIADAMLMERVGEIAPKIKYIEELRAIKEDLKQRLGNQITARIPKAFYKDNYDVDIVITDESTDLKGKQGVFATVIQTIGPNPAILQNPVVRRILGKYLESVGENAAEIFKGVEIMFQQQQQPQIGGSVAKQAPQTATQAIQSTTI